MSLLLFGPRRPPMKCPPPPGTSTALWRAWPIGLIGFLRTVGWDLVECGWDLAECGWVLTECGRDLAELWMRSSRLWMKYSRVRMRSGRVWMRSSRVMDEIEPTGDEICPTVDEIQPTVDEIYPSMDEIQPTVGWDLAECEWDLSECGRDLAECGWGLAEWLERLAINFKVTTVLGSTQHPPTQWNLKFECRQMKQCWTTYSCYRLLAYAKVCEVLLVTCCDLHLQTQNHIHSRH